MKKNKYKLIGTALAILILILVFLSRQNSSNENVSQQSYGQEEVAPKIIANKKLDCHASKIKGEWFSVVDNKKLKLNDDCSFENEKCNSAGIFEDLFLDNKGEKVIFQTKKASNVIVKDCSNNDKEECDYKFENENEDNFLVINCHDSSYKYKQHNNEVANQNLNKTQVDIGPNEAKKNNSEPLESTTSEEKELDSNEFDLSSNTSKGVMLNGSLCDGIKRGEAKKCYYTNLPMLTVTKGYPGKKYWSSTSLSNDLKKQFRTENVLNLRIIARKNGSELSTFNKKCNEKSFIATKLKVKLILRTPENMSGETATLISRIDRPSSTWNFTVPQSDQALIVDVIDVKSNSRCVKCKKSKYLDLQSGDQKGIAKECAAFDIQFATDSTYDLPGKRVNKLLY